LLKIANTISYKITSSMFLIIAIYTNVAIKTDYINFCFYVILCVFMCNGVCVFFLSLLLSLYNNILYKITILKTYY
jgi:hypothetical protein